MPSGIPKNGINIGQFKKGHSDLVPIESRKRQGLKMKGRKNPWIKGWLKGKHHSEETKKKMSEKKKGKYGKLAGGWKGGKTKIRFLIPELFEYKKWRSDVFQRDNWTCQTCHLRGIYLEAHHIKELCKIIEEFQIKNSDNAKDCKELWDINNGITLCKNCHNLTKKGGRTMYEKTKRQSWLLEKFTGRIK